MRSSKAPTGPQKTTTSQQARSASKARAELLAQMRALQAAVAHGRAVVAQAMAYLDEPDPIASAKHAAKSSRTSKLNAAALRSKLTAAMHEHDDSLNALVDGHQATFKDLIKKI